MYDNMDEFVVDGMSPTFVNYTDGIYVGYRFYETAAKEGLINQRTAEKAVKACLSALELA